MRRPGPALLLCLAIGAAPVDWTKLHIMRIEMRDNRFVPDVLSLRHGHAYRLHMVNRGKELHEFTAPLFFATSLLRDPRKLTNGGQEIVLQPGETVDVDLMPRQAGHYELICADHDWDGMIGAINVE